MNYSYFLLLMGCTVSRVLQLLLCLDPTRSAVSALSRCDYVCQADSNCKSGQCVLVYCIDTPYCFKFCLQCGYQVSCQSAGPYCYLLESSSAGMSTSYAIHILLAVLFVILTVKF